MPKETLAQPALSECYSGAATLDADAHRNSSAQLKVKVEPIMTLHKLCEEFCVTGKLMDAPPSGPTLIINGGLTKRSAATAQELSVVVSLLANARRIHKLTANLVGCVTQ